MSSLKSINFLYCSRLVTFYPKHKEMKRQVKGPKFLNES